MYFRLNSFVECRLWCERVCKQVLTQFPNMTSQFAVQHWWTCKSWCCGAWSVAGSCLKGRRTVPSSFWASCWIRRCAVAICTSRTRLRYASCRSWFAIHCRHQSIDVFANWKLGRNKTKRSSHRISRLDKTAKKLNMFSFEIFCRRQSWLIGVRGVN